MAEKSNYFKIQNNSGLFLEHYAEVSKTFYGEIDLHKL